MLGIRRNDWKRHRFDSCEEQPELYEFMHLILEDANRFFSIADDILLDKTFNYTPQVYVKFQYTDSSLTWAAL